MALRMTISQHAPISTAFAKLLFGCAGSGHAKSTAPVFILDTLWLNL